MPCFCLRKNFKRIIKNILELKNDEGWSSNIDVHAIQQMNNTRKIRNYRKRLALCKECVYVKNVTKRMRCGLCGCYLGIKASLPFMHCPVNKW